MSQLSEYLYMVRSNPRGCEKELVEIIDIMDETLQLIYMGDHDPDCSSVKFKLGFKVGCDCTKATIAETYQDIEDFLSVPG